MRCDPQHAPGCKSASTDDQWSNFDACSQQNEPKGRGLGNNPFLPAVSGRSMERQLPPSRPTSSCMSSKSKREVTVRPSLLRCAREALFIDSHWNIRLHCKDVPTWTILKREPL